MTAEASTIDAELRGALPEVSGDPVVPTDDQTVTAGEHLAANWSKAIR